MPLETSSSEHSGAPLLPPPQTAGGEPEDRFCTGGPKIEGVGHRSVGSSLGIGADIAFQDLVGRLEAAMGQASLLFSDRLRALKNKLHAGSVASSAQEVELCDIADGVSAASYHVAKWAFLLRPKSDTQAMKPTKPPRNDSTEEAFASVNFSLPRLMVSATEAQRGLTAAVKAHGAGAENRVKLQGVPVEDLRALVPHLERLLLRLGRLSSSLRLPQNPRSFIPEYFAPAIGWKPARMLARYL